MLNSPEDLRAWADHHDELSDGIARLFAGVRDTFVAISRRQFDAPWRRSRPRRLDAR